jgi:hypothetical protein
VWGEEGDMTQTMYAHVNKWVIKKEKEEDSMKLPDFNSIEYTIFSLICREDPPVDVRNYEQR